MSFHSDLFPLGSRKGGSFQLPAGQLAEAFCQRWNQCRIQPLFQNTNASHGSFIKQVPGGQQVGLLIQRKLLLKGEDRILEHANIVLALGVVPSEVDVETSPPQLTI